MEDKIYYIRLSFETEFFESEGETGSHSILIPFWLGIRKKDLELITSTDRCTENLVNIFSILLNIYNI